MNIFSIPRMLAAAAAVIIAANVNAEPIDPYEVIHVTPDPGQVTSISAWNITFDCNWGLENRSAKFAVKAPEGVEVPTIYSGSNGEAGYTVYFADNKTLTTPGTYTFTIPEGKFSLGSGVDAIVNPTMTFEYTIAAGATHFPDYAVTPAPGTYQSIDDGFRLTFDAEEVLLMNEKGVVLYGPEGDLDIFVDKPLQMPYISVIPLDAAGNPMALTQKGYYQLVFRAGSLKVDGLSMGNDISFRYLIDDPITGVWSGDYTAVPADGSIVDEISHIDVTFAGAGNVVVSDYAAAADFPHLYDADGALVTTATVFAEDNLLQISIIGKVNQPGTYTLVIPAKLIRIDSKELTEPLTLTYTIEGKADAFAYDCELHPAPGSTINAQQAISLTFSGESVASVTNDPYAWGKSAPHFTSDEGNWCPNLQVSQSDLTFILTHVYPFEETGTYTLRIPAGYFTLTSTSGEAMAAKEISAVYHVTTSSIESVENTQNTDTDVYTVTGIRLGRLGHIALAPGIYIVGGKKLIVRK